MLRFVGSLFGSVGETIQQLAESLTNSKVASVVGGVAGAVLGYVTAAFPVELPVVFAIAALVFIDWRSGVRASKARGEEYNVTKTRVMLSNKSAAYTEMYIAGLAAKTISPEAGVWVYGFLMGVIVSQEIASLLRHKRELGEIDAESATQAVAIVIKKSLPFGGKGDISEPTEAIIPAATNVQEGGNNEQARIPGAPSPVCPDQ